MELWTKTATVVPQIVVIYVITDQQTNACTTNRHIHVLNTRNSFLLIRAEKLRAAGPELYGRIEGQERAQGHDR